MQANLRWISQRNNLPRVVNRSGEIFRDGGLWQGLAYCVMIPRYQYHVHVLWDLVHEFRCDSVLFIDVGNRKVHVLGRIMPDAVDNVAPDHDVLYWLVDFVLVRGANRSFQPAYDAA